MSIQSSRYRSLRLIKRTHTAEVHEATRIGPEDYRQRVLLKRLLPKAAEDEAVRNAFFEEGRLSARLSYRGLVPVFDFGLADGLPFLIAEYIDGLNLAELVSSVKDKGDEMPLDVVALIALELVRTVAFLHEATDTRGHALGLVHRDLTPNNVLVSWEGDVRVIDLGLARLAGTRLPTNVGWTKGTDGFMSPEQGLARPIGPASDLYSVACVIHYLLTGASPLEGRAEQIKVFAGHKPKISDRIDKRLAAILERALAFEPGQRFPSAQAMAEPIWSLLRERATTEPFAAFRNWLAPLKPEQTVTRLDGVAGLFDLQLLGNLVPEESAVRQFTAQAALLTPTKQLETPLPKELSKTITRAETPPRPDPTPTFARTRPVSVVRWALATLAAMGIGVIGGLFIAPNLTGAKSKVVIEQAAPPPPAVVVAIPAPQITAELPQVTAVEVSEPEPNEPSRAPRVRRAPRTGSSGDKIDRKEIERALAKRGLDLADLAAHPRTGPTWEAFAEAEKKKNDEAAAAAEDQLLKAIGSLAIDESILKPKLERAARHLERAVSAQADGPQLEQRFLDLRVAAKRAKSDAEREEIAKAILALEGDLARGAGSR